MDWMSTKKLFSLIMVKELMHLVVLKLMLFIEYKYLNIILKQTHLKGLYNKEYLLNLNFSLILILQS